MHEVMKKRLIGLIVLVMIGVLSPLLLARYMHAGDHGPSSGPGGHGAMRVYEVKPNGQTEPADVAADATASAAATASAKSAGTQADDTARNRLPPASDTISPQSGSNVSLSREQNRASAGAKRTASANNAESGSSGPTSAPANAGKPAAPTPTSASTARNLKNARITGWVVQVASFRKQSNAAFLVRKLGAHFDASYDPGQVNGRTWYRVNVGPFGSRDAADAAAAKLHREGRQTLVRHLR